MQQMKKFLKLQIEKILLELKTVGQELQEKMMKMKKRDQLYAMMIKTENTLY